LDKCAGGIEAYRDRPRRVDGFLRASNGNITVFAVGSLFTGTREYSADFCIF
jgi:hypothetical protein